MDGDETAPSAPEGVRLRGPAAVRRRSGEWSTVTEYSRRAGRRARGSYQPSSQVFVNLPDRCLGCNGLRHTSCANRLEPETCACRCVGGNGVLAWWALAETAEHHPEAMATHAKVAASLTICGSKGRLHPEASGG